MDDPLSSFSIVDLIIPFDLKVKDEIPVSCYFYSTLKHDRVFIIFLYFYS